MNTTQSPSTDPLAAPTAAQLRSLFDAKYYKNGVTGWGPRMRLAMDHYTPDDYYEALVRSLITPGCSWADVGCGRDVFPSNPNLARELSSRAGYLLGIDPDDNVRDNAFVTERFQGLIEDCVTERRFDVITMRMVAEHITDPARSLERIGTLLAPGGQLVIYTPHKWAPMSIIASLAPFSWHNPLKRFIWRTEARDTFPTAYKLNTHADLTRHTAAHGLREVYFAVLDDCRVSARFRALHWVELQLARLCNALSLHYPERCILAVYRKT